jgi:hypothetical protein
VDRQVRLAVIRFIAGAVLLLLVLVGALSAQAGGVVTGCSDAGDFNAKLAGGGSVTFACEHETAMVPHLRPDLVQMDKAVKEMGQMATRYFNWGE